MRSWGAAEWSAAGTVATAIVALLAVIYAALQVREARKAREAQIQPFVVVSLEPSRTSNFMIELVVENIGMTLARDVSFTFDPPLKSAMSDMKLEGSYLLTHGIRTMPPRMRLARIFDSAIQRDKNPELPWRFAVRVQFSDYRGKPQAPLRYVLDLEPYRSGRFLNERGIHHAAKALEGIHALLKSTISEQRIRVSARDEDYRNWSDQWQHKRGGDTPSLGNPWPAGRPSPAKFRHLEEPWPTRWMHAVGKRLRLLTR